jgi:hypothetical protein
MIEGELGVCSRQNLTLPAAFLMNNMEEGLKHCCVKVYMTFKPSKQGGPLLYKIMIDNLQCNTHSAGKESWLPITAVYCQLTAFATGNGLKAVTAYLLQ